MEGNGAKRSGTGWRHRLARGRSAPLAGAVAAIVVFASALSGSSAASSVRTVGVVVAGERIDRGAVVSPSQLRVARLPEQYVPPGSIHDVSKAAGRVLLAGLSPGEVVTENRLARVRAGPVASLVPRGLRAFAVPTSLPRGAVVPGDRVDVLATFGSGQPHTEIVVESVEILLVLSTDHSSRDAGGVGLDAEGAGASAPSTLVLLVAPEQEQRLAYARAFASLEVAIVPSE